MYKVFELLAHVTFHWYTTFKISKKWGFSEATCGSFVRERIMVVVEFVILIGLLSVLVTAAV